MKIEHRTHNVIAAHLWIDDDSDAGDNRDEQYVFECDYCEYRNRNRTILLKPKWTRLNESPGKQTKSISKWVVTKMKWVQVRLNEWEHTSTRKSNEMNTKNWANPSDE